MKDGNGRHIVVAGATGDLGLRIVQALAKRGVAVQAIVRSNTEQSKQEKIKRAGATIALTDFSSVETIGPHLVGAECVVSALNGLEPVIVGLQTKLIRAATEAGVSRFMPSDFSCDFTKTRPGHNRNLDLRRTFMAVADREPIVKTSVLNGQFGELISNTAPIIQRKWNRVLYWGDRNQKLDFTAKDDIADYAADVALDTDAPRFSRIAGDVVSAQDIADIMSQLTGDRYRATWIGGLRTLGTIIRVTRAFTPDSEDPFPVWQGMQYHRDMVSGAGKLMPLDNFRYGKRHWKRAQDLLREAFDDLDHAGAATTKGSIVGS